MSLIGIEVIASANRQIARPDELGHRHQHGRVPDLVWSADRLGAAGGFRRDASQFSICDCSFPRRRVIGWLFAAVVAPESPDCGRSCRRWIVSPTRSVNGGPVTSTYPPMSPPLSC